MQPGVLGVVFLWLGLIAGLLTIGAYGLSLLRPAYRKPVLAARALYGVTALGVLGAFITLASLVYSHNYRYEYVFQHSGNDLHAWFRFAATWAGQEGSFLLWAAWTSVIGFLVFAKAGRYEARVMPFFVSTLVFLCAVLLLQSPFSLVPVPSAALLAQHKDWMFPPPNGVGLNPSLQNYWMTIHPPTIFFGFASLLVPFCYAVAALLWRDWDDWTPRVAPYALLSCATLGLGLFMGGYWAYETQGWHGFWAWDPVENASFFPWLAITALVHGLVVQKSRGGMARTNIFLGILSWALFLVGTYLTRSGILGDLSVHAFANEGARWMPLMYAMLVLYGVCGLVLWAVQSRQIPKRKTTGDTLVSRDFAFFMSMTLMLAACAAVTLGTTLPIFQKILHHTPSAPKASFYNMVMMPLAVLTAFGMGSVPWLAWRKTNPDTFLKKLLAPWFAMLIFGFFMIFWVQGAERDLALARAMQNSKDAQALETMNTMSAWVSPSVQRMVVVSLAALGLFAALSNAMLAYKVFRAKKPLSAGGWLAHVGMGILIIGVIVSNTFERTVRINLDGNQAAQAFGYSFQFENMTGKPLPARPLSPDYDRTNAVNIRVTPPDGESAGDNGAKTFVISPRWFIWNLDMAGVNKEEDLKSMLWPSITKSLGHDLYVTFADSPQPKLNIVELKPGAQGSLGPYTLFYADANISPGQFMRAALGIKTADGKAVVAQPGLDIAGGMKPFDIAVPELTDAKGTPGAVYLEKITPGTREATFAISLPDAPASWNVPLEVTFKPWINLVWTGVLIAVFGTLLAMVRRALEARKLPSGPTPKGGTPIPVAPETWEPATAE